MLYRYSKKITYKFYLKLAALKLILYA